MLLGKIRKEIRLIYDVQLWFNAIKVYKFADIPSAQSVATHQGLAISPGRVWWMDVAKHTPLT